MILGIKNSYNNSIEACKNYKIRKRLNNNFPIIVANNCLAGYIYKWLGLEYYSPFIWLTTDHDDFFGILENIDLLLSEPVIEISDYHFNNYETVCLVGSWGGYKILFVHYKSFDDALVKWNRRIKRMINLCGVSDSDSITDYLYSHAGILYSCGDRYQHIDRFYHLKFKNKVAFIEKNSVIKPCEDIVTINNWDMSKNGLWAIKNRITRKRWIDDFDYVSFLNGLT